MSVTTGSGWAALGRHRELCGERIFTIDAPSLGPERHVPLLVLHGFPTSSFDYAAVLDRLRQGRRVLLFDMLGYGLSAKPDRHYTMALQADVGAAFLADLGLDRIALLSHDMGDTVGGELLARRAEGAWPVEVTQRVVTNGSIYIGQAHLTDGQQMLLGLPDARLPEGIPIDASTLTLSLRATFSPATPEVPEGWTEDPVPPAAEQIVARRRPPDFAAADPLHRGTPGQRAPLHRRHRNRPGAPARGLGPRRPDRRGLHGGHAGGGAPRRHCGAPRGRGALPDGGGAEPVRRSRAAGLDRPGLTRRSSGPSQQSALGTGERFQDVSRAVGPGEGLNQLVQPSVAGDVVEVAAPPVAVTPVREGMET